jgi:hypothetical protein
MEKNVRMESGIAKNPRQVRFHELSLPHAQEDSESILGGCVENDTGGLAKPEQPKPSSPSLKRKDAEEIQDCGFSTTRCASVPAVDTILRFRISDTTREGSPELFTRWSAS